MAAGRLFGSAVCFLSASTTYRTPIDYALSLLYSHRASSFLSYEPFISIGKLRAASLFTIVYLFAENIPLRRVIRLLALTLVASCALGVLYTLGERIMGRGIKLETVAENSPLSAAILTSDRKIGALAIKSGDTVLEVDGKRMRDLDELANALNVSHGSGPARVKVYRAEWIATLAFARALVAGPFPERLGVSPVGPPGALRASRFYDRRQLCEAATYPSPFLWVREFCQQHGAGGGSCCCGNRRLGFD